jgi:hypothetical protein
LAAKEVEHAERPLEADESVHRQQAAALRRQVGDLELLKAGEGRRAEPSVDLGKETAAVYGVEGEAPGWAGVVGEDLGDHGDAGFWDLRGGSWPRG